MFLEIVLRKTLDIPCKNSNKNEKNLEIFLVLNPSRINGKVRWSLTVPGIFSNLTNFKHIQ